MMKHDETMLASWFSHCLTLPSLITSLLPSFLIPSLILLPLIHFQVLIHFISWSNMTGDRGWNEMKWDERKRKNSQQPASQQYIYQYKIQSIVPNTFTNKESIAHKASLHHQWKKKLNHFPQLFGVVINHYPTLNFFNTWLDVFEDGKL